MSRSQVRRISTSQKNPDVGLMNAVNNGLLVMQSMRTTPQAQLPDEQAPLLPPERADEVREVS
jgi:hypothetical protein